MPGTKDVTTMYKTCYECAHAIFDYEELYGTAEKEWFVDGCKLGLMDDSANTCEHWEDRSE